MPISAHVYSNWLAIAASSSINYGEQCYSDDLTAAIGVYTIKKTVRCRFFKITRIAFTAELQTTLFQKLTFSCTTSLSLWIVETEIALLSPLL